MSSDESLDSLPSPGFVSVFRHRHPPTTEREGEADGGADGAVGGEAEEGEGEAEEGEVVVEAVQGGGHKIEQRDVLVPGVFIVRN